MTEDNHYIDAVFKEQLADGKSETPSGEWTQIARKIRWQRFLNFGMQHFNVYYAALSVGVTGLVLTGLLYFSDIKEPSQKAFPDTTSSHPVKEVVDQEKVFNSKKDFEVQHDAKNDDVIFQKDQSSTSNTKPIPAERNTLNEIITATSEELNITTKEINNNNPDKKNITETEKENSLPENNESPDIKSIAEEQKTIYIYHPDTVVNYDTTRIIDKKKRIRWK